MAAGVIGWCRVTDRASSFETLPATSRLSRVCGAEFNQQTLLAPVGWCVFYTGAMRWSRMGGRRFFQFAAYQLIRPFDRVRVYGINPGS